MKFCIAIIPSTKVHITDVSIEFVMLVFVWCNIFGLDLHPYRFYILTTVKAHDSELCNQGK